MRAQLKVWRYIVADDRQNGGILRVVVDRRLGVEGQNMTAETPSKVIGNKDPSHRLSRNLCCQDDLQDKIQTDETTESAKIESVQNVQW